MTEAEWLASEDVVPLLLSLKYRNLNGNKRRVRLFASACCRRVWHLLKDPRSRLAVEGAERFADRRGSSKHLSALCDAAWQAAKAVRRRALRAAAEAVGDAAQPGEPTPCAVSFVVADAVARDVAVGRLSLSRLRKTPEWNREQVFHAILLRDIFANPFRPPPPIPASVLQWSRCLVRQLAAAAYKHRLLPSGHLDPERLGVLADALEEAGADAQLVEHLRGLGPHVRGCHVIDLLTGRE